MTRRAALSGVALGVAGGCCRAALGQTPDASGTPDRMLRPQKGDRLVFLAGANAGKQITPDLLTLGGPQVLAWAVDPATGTVRDGSRLNQVLVVRLDEQKLNDATRQRSAGGVVAYSSICTHAQCSVAEWVPARQVLHCPCHNSEYDPCAGADVVHGPATRPLAALPLVLSDNVLSVADPFVGRVGAKA